VSQLASENTLLVLEPRPTFQIRPAAAMQAMLLLLVIANLGRIPVLSAGGRSFPILVNDLAVTVMVGMGLVFAVQHRTIKLDLVAALGLAFAAVGGLSALASQARFGLSWAELGVGLAYLFRWLLYFALYVVGVNTLRRQDVQPVWGALETCILLFAAFGIFQSAFLPGFAQMLDPNTIADGGWDVQGRRLVSTFLDPNFAGGLLMLGLLVELGLLASGERVAWWKPLMLFGAMVLTLSRGTLLAFTIGFIVLIAVRGVSRRLAMFLAGGALVLAAALPSIIRFAASFNKLGVSDASAQGRFVLWLRALTVLRDHPIIGIGFDTWAPVARRYGWVSVPGSQNGVDGGLLFIAVLTGAVGVAIYLGMLGYTFLRARVVWRQGDRPAFERGLAGGVGACLVAMCVHSLFSNSLLLPYLMEPLWIMCALVFVLARAES